MNEDLCLCSAMALLKADVAAEVKVEFFSSLRAGFFLQGSDGIVAHHSW